MFGKIISPMWSPVNAWLDRSSMYLVVLVTLGALVVIALALSVFGLMPQTPFEQVRSLGTVLLVALVCSYTIATLTRIPANHQSSIITALILYFLFEPAFTWTGLSIVAAATAIAIVSKYVVVYRKQHLVNAAAFGAAALSLPGFAEATWWIGAPPLFIPLVLAGALVVTKIRKWPMVLTFLGVGFLVFLFEEWRFGVNPLETWSLYWLSYPALFLAVYMLTEPFSTPGRRHEQLLYAGVVGFLSSTALLMPYVAMSPELALVIGNLVVLPWLLRQKLFLKLQAVREVTPGLFEYTFSKPTGMRFLPGQYLEWMVPHASPDKRGIRRYFTIASSPTESSVRLALRQPTPGSSYKQALKNLPIGGTVIASQRAGDFLLPTDSTIKIGWIAGGIGVTPFVSQAQYLSDTNESRDIVLLYAVRSAADLAYQADLARVARIVPVVSDGAIPEGGYGGYLSATSIKESTPDYRDRTWFISGPPPMVLAAGKALSELGVPQTQIIKDFFPGLA